MTMNILPRLRSLPTLLLLSTGILLGSSGYAQDSTGTRAMPDKWDLRHCVDYAVANNISVKQSDVQARLSKLTLDQSKWNRIPTLGFGFGAGINSGRSQNPTNYTLSTLTYNYNNYGVQSSVNVFNFFSLQNTIAANKLSWQAAMANSDKLKNDISLNVANAYLQVLLADEQTNAARLQLRLSQSQLDITRKQVKAGSLPELNAAELEAQVAQDSANFISLQGTVVQNVLTLKAYMGLDASVLFEVATPPVGSIPIEKIEDLQPEAVYSMALYNQPLQKMDLLQVASAQKMVKANKGALYPTFTISGSLGANYVNNAEEPIISSGQTIEVPIGKVYGTNTPVVYDQTYYNYKKTPYFSQLNQNFSQGIGLNINVPIFSNYNLRTNYEKSKLNLRNTELQRDQDNLTLKQNIYQAYTSALTARQKFEANKISVAATQKSFEYAQKRYNVGMLNTIDLLTNQNNFFNAKINALSSEYDYVFKMKVLEFYKGMGIKL
jgi:outer membrane protein